jgi:hypothetical protein
MDIFFVFNYKKNTFEPIYNKNNILAMAQIALGAQNGAKIGFSVFGPKGGLLGATLGATFGMFGTIAIMTIF